MKSTFDLSLSLVSKNWKYEFSSCEYSRPFKEEDEIRHKCWSMTAKAHLRNVDVCEAEKGSLAFVGSNKHSQPATLLGGPYCSDLEIILFTYN